MENNLPVNVREYQELAKKALPKMAYDYINGGAEDEHTLRENIAAYGRIILRPRVLVDVSKIDMSTTLLGYNMPSPIIVAPTGGHKLAHPEGEKATARAAASCNAIMVLSSGSSYKIEDVASSCNAIRFYQLYVYKWREVSERLVRRAESCGFKALVLTVDTPMLGRREADIRNKMVFPPSANLEELKKINVDTTGGSQLEGFARATLDPSLSWKDIEWLKSITTMPILLKGIVGRPVFFGLAARGEAGARHVIEMLNGELEVAMALCGCRSVGEITRSHVMTEGDRIRSLL
uniref:FMN hydroxy acid dehydrogenase domain-containing protein n=1 Tax=Leersia perrieri TaxID=77586 RepID=A0A0D9X1I0_9ORYZ